MAESEEELKRLLMKVKEESEKAGLKLNIQKTKIVAPSPITSWQIDEGTMETVTDFIFLGSRITAVGDCSREIKRHLLQRNPRADLLQNGLVGSPCSPRDSQESSSTPQFKSISSSVLSFLYSPTLTSIHDYWKNHSFDYMDLCWQSNVSAF